MMTPWAASTGRTSTVAVVGIDVEFARPSGAGTYSSVMESPGTISGGAGLLAQPTAACSRYPVRGRPPHLSRKGADRRMCSAPSGPPPRSIGGIGRRERIIVGERQCESAEMTVRAEDDAGKIGEAENDTGVSRPRRAGRTRTTDDGSSEGAHGHRRRPGSCATREFASELGWSGEALLGWGRRATTGRWRWPWSRPTAFRRCPTSSLGYEVDFDDAEEWLSHRRRALRPRGRGDNERYA